jgi:sensor histidine kinase YesM
VAFVLIAFVIIDTLLIFADQFAIHLIMMDAQRYFMASFGIIGSIYLLIKRKSPLVYFIVSGSFAYTLGALGTLFLLDLYYILTGSGIEIFIFTLGLGYKSRNLLVEHSQIQREVLQLEMRALRAQMNPHFIFNALGSIQHLIRRDKKQDALQYLSKFSQLLRQILDSSNHGTVTLKEETDLLRNYMELESLRFEGRFHYQLTVSESLDQYNIEIPILLIQPHVENAILHGLLPKQGEARLDISFENQSDVILCQVRDNGIGRQKSAELKPVRGVTHQSRGLSIVAERVNNMSGKTEDIEHIKIEDIFDEQGMAAGTQVSIRIPKDD